MLTTLITRTASTVLAVFLTVFAVSAPAQLYRWVDKSGRVTYSQNPPPPGVAKSVQQKSLGSHVVENPGLPYAAQLAVKNFPVTLYTAPDCDNPCKEGKALLSKRGVPYKEVVTGDEQSIAALKNLTGKAQVPVLLIGREATTGFNPVTWKNALDSAGYPDSIPALITRPSPSVQRKLPAVKLYATSLCGLPCQDARALLTARSITFQEVLIQDEDSLAEMKTSTGSETVPTLMIGSSSIRGFSTDLYQSSLDAAGFPPPGTNNQ